MKHFAEGFLSIIVLGYAGSAAALPTCTKATVDVGGGGTSVQYFCTDGTVFTNAPPASQYLVINGGGGGSGGSPLGGRFNPIQVKFTAPNACSDETSEGAAGDTFRKWEVAINPGKSASMLAADAKYYNVSFSDGHSQVYQWRLPLASSLPLQLTDGVCR